MEINILVAAVILLKAAIPFSQHPPSGEPGRQRGLWAK